MAAGELEEEGEVRGGGRFFSPWEESPLHKPGEDWGGGWVCVAESRKWGPGTGRRGWYSQGAGCVVEAL